MKMVLRKTFSADAMWQRSANSFPALPFLFSPFYYIPSSRRRLLVVLFFCSCFFFPSFSE